MFSKRCDSQGVDRKSDSWLAGRRRVNRLTSSGQELELEVRRWVDRRQSLRGVKWTVAAVAGSVAWLYLTGFVVILGVVMFVVALAR